MKPVVLITGTSTGLGVSIAAQAAAAGHTVYATMRNVEKRAALDEAVAKACGTNAATVHVLPLDVQQTASVDAVVEQILAREGRIDVLVNNAGSGFVRTTEQASEAEIQTVLDVNFMGVVRCTKAVLPHMRKARAGRIVTVSSVGGLVGQPFNEIYCAAKFAVEGYMEALATYVTPSFGVHFTLVEPGGIATEFAPNVLRQIAATGGMLEDEYLPILQKYIGGSATRQTGSDIYQTADEVAAVVLACMTAEAPPIRTRTSKWGEAFTSVKTSLDPDGKKTQAKIIAEFLT